MTHASPARATSSLGMALYHLSAYPMATCSWARVQRTGGDAAASSLITPPRPTTPASPTPLPPAPPQRDTTPTALPGRARFALNSPGQPDPSAPVSQAGCLRIPGRPKPSCTDAFTLRRQRFKSWNLCTFQSLSHCSCGRRRRSVCAETVTVVGYPEVEGPPAMWGCRSLLGSVTSPGEDERKWEGTDQECTSPHWAPGIAACSPSRTPHLPSPRPTRQVPLTHPTPRRTQDQSPLIPARPGLTEKRLKDKEPSQEAQGAAATAGTTWAAMGPFCSPLRSAAPPRGGALRVPSCWQDHTARPGTNPRRSSKIFLRLIQQRPILARVLKTPEHITKSFALEIVWILSLSVF